jgi:hypothetical protein
MTMQKTSNNQNEAMRMRNAKQTQWCDEQKEREEKVTLHVAVLVGLEVVSPAVIYVKSEVSIHSFTKN